MDDDGLTVSGCVYVLEIPEINACPSLIRETSSRPTITALPVTLFSENIILLGRLALFYIITIRDSNEFIRRAQEGTRSNATKQWRAGNLISCSIEGCSYDTS